MPETPVGTMEATQMTSMLNRLHSLPYKLLASATVAMASTGARAEGNVGDVADNLITQASSVGKLIVAGSFIGGLVMLGTGLMKLKQAAENPNQTKYSEGIWRVAVGAALVAIPAFTGTLSETLGLGAAPGITAGGGATF